MIDPVLAEIVSRSLGRWTGCDWTTAFGPLGLNLHGLKAEQAQLVANATSGREAAVWRDAVGWLRQVEIDACEAQTHANLAVEWARLGNFELALTHAGHAFELEARYREPVVWKPLLVALQGLEGTIEYFI
jgi:hypothetical protein